MVQEAVQGGDLFDYIAHTGCFSENVCRYFLKQMLKAVDHMHSKSYAHRDLYIYIYIYIMYSVLKDSFIL